MQSHFIHPMVLVELYSAEPVFKTIKNFKGIQTKKRLLLFVSARLQKYN